MNGKAKSQRLDPLPPETTPEMKEEFDSFFKTLGFVPNSVLTMQRKPKLAKAFVQMQRAIWDPDSKVDRGFKRLVAHAASRTANDPYSMAHTASGALHFGIDAAKLAAVRDYKKSPLFNDAERTALDLAVSASSTPNAVTEHTFSELRRHWSEEQIVELVGVIAVAGLAALADLVRIVTTGAIAVNADQPYRRLLGAVHDALSAAPATRAQRRRHLGDLRVRADEANRFNRLTARECAVLVALATGASAEGIAASRPVGLATVRSQMSARAPDFPASRSPWRGPTGRSRSTMRAKSVSPSCGRRPSSSASRTWRCTRGVLRRGVPPRASRL